MDRNRFLKMRLDTNKELPTDKVKGQKNGLCNRRACQSPKDVIFYNKGTSKYYCYGCAVMINKFNPPDPTSEGIMRVFKGDPELCMTDDKLTPDQWVNKLWGIDDEDQNDN